jgi:hypothetical protein
MPILQRFSVQGSGVRPIPATVILRIFLGNIIGFYVTALLLSDPSLPAELRNVQLVDFIDIFTHGILESQKTESNVP